MSAPAMENPIILNIMTSYGALLIGSFLSQAIWGISTLQVFMYFRNYDTDHLFLKVSIALLWAIDTADQILLLKGNFKVLILQYGRVAGLLENQGELIYHSWLAAIVYFYVQMYFIRRLWLFGKKAMGITIFCSLLTILTSWQLLGVVVYWIFAYGKPLAVQGTPMLSNINISTRASAVVTDVCIAVGMVWLLTHQDAPRFQKTKRMFFRIIMITINSGTWTALAAFIVLILVRLHPDQLTWCILEYTLCSLYFTTFMANLNARNYVIGAGGVSSATTSTMGAGTYASGYGAESTQRSMALQLKHMGSNYGQDSTMNSDVTKAVHIQRDVYVDSLSPTKEGRSFTAV